MRYINEAGMIVNVLSGGLRACAVMESMGYSTEEDMSKKKHFVKTLTGIQEMKKRPALVVKGALVERKNGSKSLVGTLLTGSRNDLMLKVKAMHVKNFRVLNKAELLEIIDGATAERVQAIVDAAVLRWKSGWKTKTNAK